MTIKKILSKLIPQVLTNYIWHLPMAIAANICYGFPSKYIKVIGITGTDGKTTTSHMLYHILESSGLKTALISTVGAKMGGREVDTGLHVTTPDPFMLQKLLKQIREQGCTHVVIEGTSHGFDQFRLWGVQFIGGIVTNITIDHLDYHKTWDKYVLAKARLFSQTKFAVLNAEDRSYPLLSKKAHGRQISYGKAVGDYNLTNTKVDLQVLGEYNKVNALAAVAAAVELGIDVDSALTTLRGFEGVKGRMEVMHNREYKVVVDFAHTPNALKTALGDLRKMTNGRLISVFGCAGQRDAYRRRMGEVSAQLADITIITAEDPREEGVERISNEIAQWAQDGGAQLVDKDMLVKNKVNGHVYLLMPDRKEAIAYAVDLARKGDTVGIFGKGHERSMCFGTEEIPWSDQQAVREVVN